MERYMSLSRLISIAIATVASAALLVAATPPASSDDATPSVETPAPSIAAADGKALYMKKCKKCHGPDGKADTKMGKKHKIDVIPGKYSKAKVLKVIKNGVPKTKMKSFASKLSEDEIAAVADFVMTL